jgi:hypothetical protein
VTITTRASLRAVRRPRSMSSPSPSRMLRSSRIRSGRSSRASASPSAPLAASPTRTKAGIVRSSCTSPRRNSGWSSTISTRQLSFMSPFPSSHPRCAIAATLAVAARKAHAHPGAARQRRRDLDLPAHAARALAHDRQAVVVARVGRRRADAAAVVAHLQPTSPSALAAQLHPRVARRGVAHHVRQGLAHDLQHVHLLVRAELAGAELHRERDLQAAAGAVFARRVLHQGGEVGRQAEAEGHQQLAQLAVGGADALAQVGEDRLRLGRCAPDRRAHAAAG